jgi:hypothetical protein
VQEPGAIECNNLKKGRKTLSASKRVSKNGRGTLVTISAHLARPWRLTAHVQSLHRGRTLVFTAALAAATLAMIRTRALYHGIAYRRHPPLKFLLGAGLAAHCEIGSLSRHDVKWVAVKTKICRYQKPMIRLLSQLSAASAAHRLNVT